MTPDADHPPMELLADAAAELLPDDESRTVEDHLARCADCAAVAAALTEVGQVLRDTPSAPMPDSVFARLNSAVRAESERRASGAAEAEARAAAVEAARRTALGTFGQNPAAEKKVRLRAGELAGDCDD